MSRYDDIPSEVRDLAPSACDDALTAEEAARLESACTDDARLRLLVDYLQLDADLSILMQGDEALARSLRQIGSHSAKDTAGADSMSTCESGEKAVPGKSFVPATSRAPIPPINIIISTEGESADTPHGVIAYFSSGWPMAYLASTVICAIGILILASIPVQHYVQIARQSVDSPSGAETGTGSRSQDDTEGSAFDKADEPLDTSFPPLIGQITGMVDCQWSDPQTEAFDRAYVPLGRKYAISSGLMEITYDSGAKVILQGPCTYEVESASGGYLSLGKLTARVEKRSEVRGQRSEAIASSPRSSDGGHHEVVEAGGEGDSSPLSTLHSPLFAVRTPTAIVTDLGTEFGVEVRRDGDSRVAVLQGLVTVTAGRTGEPQTVRDGEAVRIERMAEVDMVRVVGIPHDTVPTFVRDLRSVDPRAYMRTVLADKPAFYWTFDESEGSAFEQVRHQPEQALQPSDRVERYSHTVAGSGLALGRAAEFTGTNCFASRAMGYGVMPGAWAVEFWVQAAGDPENRPKQYLMNAGVDSPGRRPNNPGILFNCMPEARTNELQLFGGGGRTQAGPILGDQHWHHAILVFYGNDKGFGVAARVDAAMDGQLNMIDRGGFNAEFDLTGVLLLGTDTRDLSGPFYGRIDELAIYDLSSLTVEQIEARMKKIAQHHYAAGRLNLGPETHLNPMTRNEANTQAAPTDTKEEAIDKHTQGKQ